MYSNNKSGDDGSNPKKKYMLLDVILNAWGKMFDSMEQPSTKK